MANDLSTDLALALAQMRDDEEASRFELLGDLQFDDLPDLAEWVAAARHQWHEKRDGVLAAAAAARKASGAIAPATQPDQPCVAGCGRSSPRAVTLQ